MRFAVSYAALGALVFLEGMILREALQEVRRLGQFYLRVGRRRQESEGLPQGSPAPDFSAPVLDSNETLNTADLKGDSTLLLFISPLEASLPGYQQFAVAVHALWHQTAPQIVGNPVE